MAYARLSDYETRYGEADDPASVEVFLEDATAMIDSSPGFHRLGEEDPGFETQTQLLARITCAIVYRALSPGQFAGYESVSQGVGGFTASVNLANPSGDLYLTSNEKRLLGIGRGRIGQTRMWGAKS